MRIFLLSQKIKSIAEGVQSTLHSTVGHTYSPSVSVESALPDRIEKLLQRLTVTVGDDSAAPYRGELIEQSLGGANLIYLALKLLEYEVNSPAIVSHISYSSRNLKHIFTRTYKKLSSKIRRHEEPG